MGKTLVEALTLPEELSEASNKLGDYSILLYGQPKIGKTSLAAEFPDAFFLMCEPGGVALEIYQRPVTNWKTFVGYVDLLENDTKYQTIIIDTADNAFDYCSEHICQANSVDHLSQMEWGKGYQAAGLEFKKQINRLIALDKGIILISHSKETEITTRSGRKYQTIEPSIANTGKKVLNKLCDIIAYYIYSDKERDLQIRGDDEITAGGRPTNCFMFTDGTPMSLISMGKSAKEAYTNLNMAFENKIERPVKEEVKEKESDE